MGRLTLALALGLCVTLAACGDSTQLDPCQTMACPLPAAPRCDGSTQVVAEPATCSVVGDAADCMYAETRTDCSTMGMACAAGACHPPEDPCASATCDTPPVAACADDVATTYDATGTCDGSTGTAVCSYTPHTTDCTTTKQVCQGGACVDPCTGVTCTTPPADTCADPGTLHDYPAVGTCDGSSGAAVCVYTATDVNCTDDDHVCDTGACVDPCATNPCTTPPADTCDADGTAEEHANPGTCTSPGGAVHCDYAVTPVDCPAADKACASGACVDPCVGFACTTPPDATCSDNTLTTFSPTGTCSSPAGVPGCDYAATPVDCTLTNQVCSGDACVDPCIGVTCEAPPAATCVGAGSNTARTFAASGTCSSPGGTVECSYAQTDTDCALTGQACAAGACTGPKLFCRVQFPDAITDVATTTPIVYGRVFIEGVTDVSGGNDPTTALIQLGLGTGTDPSTFTYAAATPNASYGPASPGYEANNDEYQGTFVVPNAPGTTQHYAYRLSNDGGTTWMYCDTGQSGSSDGFTTPGTLNIAAPYFSEYVEGSAVNSRAIEIYNPGSIPFPLAGCKLLVFANGQTTSTNVVLTTTNSIAPGDVYTVCKTGYTLAGATACDQSTGAGLWTGNDAIELACTTGTAQPVIYDVLGQIGFDPGAEWGTGNTSTADNTLLRTCSIFAGDTDGSDVFDPSVQWQGYATDSSFLGARNCPLPAP